MDLFVRSMHLGGPGMWLTLVSGAVLIFVAVRHAIRPERRFIPLIVSLGIVTLLAGALGFTSGLIRSLAALHEVGPDERYITLIGLGESLYNLAFAVLLVLVGAVATAVGAWRVARMLPQESPQLSAGTGRP